MKTLTVRIKENVGVDSYVALTGRGKPYTFIKGVPMKIPEEEAKELVSMYKILEIIEEKKPAKEEKKVKVEVKEERKEEKKAKKKK